jgi:hypothetical protein
LFTAGFEWFHFLNLLSADLFLMPSSLARRGSSRSLSADLRTLSLSDDEESIDGAHIVTTSEIPNPDIADESDTNLPPRKRARSIGEPGTELIEEFSRRLTARIGNDRQTIEEFSVGIFNKAAFRSTAWVHVLRQTAWHLV